MPARLGDGLEGRAETLGGGPFGDDVFTTGARSSLFIALRHERHERNLLGVAAAAHSDPITGGGVGEGGDTGDGDGDSGDGGGGGGGGGDGGDG